MRRYPGLRRARHIAGPRDPRHYGVRLQHTGCGRQETPEAGFDALLADIEQTMATPYNNARLRNGQKRKNVRTDINNVPPNGRSQVWSALFQLWHPHHATSEDLMSGVPSLESIDVMMHAMGFDLLGDMLCEYSSDVIRRGYACADSRTYALLMVGTSGQHGLDFYTRFDDNSFQTTTSLARMDDQAPAGTFCTSYPDTDYQTLYTLHLQHLEQKITQGVEAQAITPTLEALATCLEECLQRQGL